MISNKKRTNNQNLTISPWLPYWIGTIGSLLSIIIGAILLLFPPLYSTTLLPWVILISGVLISGLSAIVVHLYQFSHSGLLMLSAMNDQFQKEISERIKTEESKQKLEIALLQGQKLQAIGTLAGGIAHDFNNIIYAIKGYVEMAQEDMPSNSLVYNNLGKVLEAAQRGQDLVARILAFGRRHQHHEFKPIQIKNILESVLSLLRPTIPAGVTIYSEDILDEDIILGDQTQLHQVIVNIINNAVDAMDGEGTITIVVNRIEAYDPYLNQFPDKKNINYYKIDFTDTGHGMDQAIMERIFEPFYTTKEVGKGTGLGLATVHTIIKEHQGEITVSSQLGKGTTFTLLLPESESKEALTHDSSNYTVSGR